jgi:hypothetical protein
MEVAVQLHALAALPQRKHSPVITVLAASHVDAATNWPHVGRQNCITDLLNIVDYISPHFGRQNISIAFRR